MSDAYAIPRLALPSADVEWSLPFSPFGHPRRRAIPLPTLSKGERMELPSHNIVELLRPMAIGELRWECGYVIDGKVLPEGNGFRNRLTVREDWLLKFGVPAS